MASGGTVWGIEVGQCALKALKVRAAGEGQVEALAFDVIEHPKLLSQPDADPDELIRAAVEKFASRNEWQRDAIVIGVPGQQTFSRFCKLPPVDQKKIPDIVKFEASQQIPFDMDDVVWDYQVFSSEDSPETEVGIFAMRKDLVRKHIEFFGEAGIQPTAIQALPSALYNFAYFEHPPEDEGTATVLIDVGAQNTDLVVIESNSAWTRNIPLGGNNFTEALIKAFKLSFAKAESLKRTAASSKYARQIFQAMRPVFAELVAEIQRSLGFYSSTHRDVELKRVVALGNAFRLPGLQKYLENNLTVGDGVVKPEKLKTLTPSETINAPQFTENILSFGAAYGLALQGLGEAKIGANLLPTELARVAAWKRKTPYWIGTAAALAVAAVSPWARSYIDTQALDAAEDDIRTRTQPIISKAQNFQREYNEASKDTGAEEAKIESLLELRDNAATIPRVLALVHTAMPAVDPRILQAQTPEEFARLVRVNPELVRTNRKQLIIEDFELVYSDGIDKFQPGRKRQRQGPTASPMASGPMGNPYMMGMGGMSGPMGMGGMGGYGGGGGSGRADDTDEGEGTPGFYVRLIGRLLYGTSKGDASRVIAEDYFKSLQDRQRTEGLGFYVMLDDPEDDVVSFTPPVLTNVNTEARSDAGAAGLFLGAREKRVAEDEEEQIDPRFIDPVTGESMLTDWRFEFGFKIAIGDPATEEDADAGAADDRNDRDRDRGRKRDRNR